MSDRSVWRPGGGYGVVGLTYPPTNVPGTPPWTLHFARPDMIDVTTATDEFLDLIAAGTISTDERVHADALLEREIRAAHRLTVVASGMASGLAGDGGPSGPVPTLAEVRALWDRRLSSAVLTAAVDLMRVLFVTKARRLLADGHDTS